MALASDNDQAIEAEQYVRSFRLLLCSIPSPLPSNEIRMTMTLRSVLIRMPTDMD